MEKNLNNTQPKEPHNESEELSRGLNYIRDLTSELGKSRLINSFKSRLKDDDFKLIDSAFKKAIVEPENYNHIRQIYRSRYGDEKINEYDSIESSLMSLTERDTVELSGSLANEMVRDIFTNASNSNVINQARLFVNPEKFKSLSSESLGAGRVIYFLTTEKISIPLGMFISADSFESWHGRPEEITKDGRLSLDVIKDYAGRETKPPQIEQIEAYLLPDNRIYIKSANSHRVAAAIRRGDEYLEFKGSIRLVLLEEVPSFLQN